MRKISFEFSINKNIQGINDFYSKKDLKIALYLEGHLQIYIEERLFFEEFNFPILELLIQLSEWKEKILTDNIENFYYCSIETEDFPILSFEKFNNYFRIKSIWQKFSCNTLLNKVDLLHFTDELYIKTDKEIKANYGKNFKIGEIKNFKY